MIKKLLPQFFLALVKFPVSFQPKIRVKNNITIGDKSLKLVSLFCNNNANLCARKIVFFSVLFFSVSFANAATRTSTGTGGAWSSGASWVGGIAPLAGDDVVIATTGVNSVTLGANTSIANVTINSGGTLKITGFTLTATGTFVNNGTFTATTGTINLTGNFTNSGTFSFSGAGGLNLGGNYSNSATVTLLSAKIQFNGSADQTIQGFTTTGSVSMLKSGGTATFNGNVGAAALTINGALGTLNLGTGLTHTFSGVVSLTNGTLNGGSSTLIVNPTSTTAWNGTGSNFVAGTGTVKFGGAAQTLATPSIFNNLILSGSGTKTFSASPTVNGILAMEGTAVVGTNPPIYGPTATLRYNRTTAVNTSLEWVTPFVATGGVSIINTGAITLITNKVFNTSIPLVVNPGSTLNIAAKTIAINDAFTNNGTIKGTTGFISLTGNFTNAGTITFTSTGGLILPGNYSNTGTVSLGSASVQFIGNTNQAVQSFTTTGVVSMLKSGGIATLSGNVNAGGLTINGTGGTLNLGSSLTHVFSGTWIRTNGTLDCGSSLLRMGGSISGTGGFFTANTGTVDYYKTAAQTCAVVIYNNLTLSGLLNKTFATTPTVNGKLSLEGTAMVVVTAGVVTYGPNATLQYNTTFPRNATLEEWITPFTATGGVIITNTGAITSNSNKVFTSAPLTINNGAILDNGGSLGFTISGGSTLLIASGGTLKLSGVSTFPTGFATVTIDPSSTVEYSGSAQTVATRNYGNLILSGSGNKTFTAATNIVGNLAVNGTAIAILLNGSTSSSQTLTFSGSTQSATGSWGGTGSLATNKNSTTFGSGTTGIINVISACMTGTWLGTVDTNWNNSSNWCNGSIPNGSTDIIITTLTNQPVISAASVCRNMSIGNGASFTIMGSNTLSVSGDWINNGTFIGNSSTVNFNGTITQVIGGSASNSFYNLTDSNTVSNLTAASNFIINNSLNVADKAVLDMSSFVLNGGGSFSNLGTGQVKTANTSVAPLPLGKTWTSLVIYNNLAGGQTIVGGTYNGIPSLNLDNTSGTQTASGNIITGNQFNIDNGGTQTFNMNGFDLNTDILNLDTTGSILDMGVGNLSYTALASMEGTIRFSGVSNGKPFGSGTVEYYGGTQNVTGGTYSNLLFSGLSGNYTIGSDININNSLTVTKGALKVQDSFSLLVGDAVTVTAPGSLTLENNASLVQTSFTGSNVGNINVRRNTAPIFLDDFIYWSSPTSGSQTLYDFSPNTQGDKYFDYNNDFANVNAATTVFSPGIGYAIRSPEGASTSTATIDTSFKFSGVPNNGTINVPVTVRTSGVDIGTGERLIGNPYPSAIDADDFIDANITGGSGTKTISGTLYFWTHNHRIVGNNYDDIDYATYTKAGGVGVPFGAGNTVAPTRYIPSGQGFFVEVDADGTISFDNSMREVNHTNTNFYKSVSALKKQNNLEETHRIWLNLTNNSINGSQTLVGYVTNATNNFDRGYDGLVYNDNQPYALYSLIGTDKLAIQARALPFVNIDTVPLGYAINVAGNATISIDHVDGLFLDDQNIYLEDKLLDIVHDLKAKSYNFQTAAGSFNDRFVLRYTDKTLGKIDFKELESQIVISKDKNELRIKSELETIKRITVFDIQGRKIFEKDAVNNNEFRTSNIALNKQTGIVKITLTNGQIISKKVVF